MTRLRLVAVPLGAVLLLAASDRVIRVDTARSVLVQDKSGRHSPYANAIRVSPPPYATPRELDRLVDAVRAAARTGVTAAS